MRLDSHSISSVGTFNMLHTTRHSPPQPPSHPRILSSPLHSSKTCRNAPSRPFPILRVLTQPAHPRDAPPQHIMTYLPPRDVLLRGTYLISSTRLSLYLCPSYYSFPRVPRRDPHQRHRHKKHTTHTRAAPTTPLNEHRHHDHLAFTFLLKAVFAP